MSIAWKQFCEDSGVNVNDRVAMREWLRKPMPRNDDGTPAYITQQSDKDAADINKIIQKFDAKDIMDLQGQFTIDETALVDVTSMDFKEAMDIQKRVESEFYELRADVRATFENDPSNYLEFLQRPTKAKDDVMEVVDKVKGKKTSSEAVSEPVDVAPIVEGGAKEGV